MLLCFTLIYIFTFIYEVKSCETSSFKNIRVTASTRSAQLDLILNDCIESDAETKNYINLEVISQNIETLKRGAIANLPIVSLNLINNRISELQKGSFLNLKSLQTLNLSKNRIKALFKDVLNDLVSMKVLDLTQNDLEQIEDEAFAHLVSLEELKLTRNKLKVWNPNWFANNRALNKLNVEENILETLPSQSFKDMEKLSSLILRGNNLREIHEDAFRGLKSLRELDLSYNEILKLPNNLFVPFNGKIQDVQSSYSSMDAHFYEAFTGLQRLYIHFNNITYLSKKSMADLTTRSFTFLTLHSNPWQCACYREIINFFIVKRIRIDSMGKGCYRKDNPVCVVPDKNPKLCVEEVDEDIRSVYFSKFQTPVNDFFDRNVVCNSF